MFEKLSKVWNEIDFIVHALAYSDKEELKGKYVNCSRENFLNSLIFLLSVLQGLQNHLSL